MSLVIGTMMPSEANAQEGMDDETRLTGDSGMTVRDESEETDGAEDGAEPERVELSFGIAPSLSGLGGLGGLAGLAGMGGVDGLGGLGGLQGGPWGGLRMPVAIDVAIPLGSRALLAIGGAGSYSEGGGASALALQVPLSVLCYLDRPRVSAFVPIARVMLRGTYAEMHGGLGGSTMLALGAGARGGLTYSFDDAIAIRAELGAGIDATFAAGFTSVALDLESSLTLVLRT